MTRFNSYVQTPRLAREGQSFHPRSLARLSVRFSWFPVFIKIMLNYRAKTVQVGLVFSMMLVLSGCKYNFITQNKPLMLEVEIDRGSPIYRAGYHDGCTSALSAYGNSYQKSLYRLQRNPEYQKDKLYNQIWKDSWAYCYQWMFAYNNEKTTSMYGKPLF